jgi:hypothetical protein
VEGDRLGLDLALLDIDLVTAEHDRDALADTDEVAWMSSVIEPISPGAVKLTVPVGNVLVGDTRGHIEHDDTALAVNVVSIAQTTELLLTSGIPHVELDCAQVLRELARTRGGDEQAGVRGIRW